MHPFARWHGRIGAAVALIIASVTLTGLLLQHAQDLGLNRISVTNPTILSLYAADLPTQAFGIELGAQTLIWKDQLLFLSETSPVAMEKPLLGAVRGANGPVVATADALYLFTENSHLIERIDHFALPGQILAIGRKGVGEVVLATDRGSYLVDSNFVEFTATDDAEISWSEVEEMTMEELPAFAQTAFPSGLPLDRILLDLHTGRLLGALGVWIINLASLAFIVLAVTGLTMAIRRNGVDKQR